MGRFNEIMQVIFRWEGGYVNNPYDNGGPTNMGITHSVLAKWRGVSGVTPQEVEALGKAEAAEIFRARYWNAIGGEVLPAPLDLVMLDGAVNHGVPATVKMLQQILGLEMTGQWDESAAASLALAGQSQGGAVQLALALAEARKARYLGHEDSAHFIRGWTNRLNDVMASALRSTGQSWTFARGAAAEVDHEAVSSISRAVIEDADLQAALQGAGLLVSPVAGVFDGASVAAMDQFLASRAARISGDWRLWAVPRRKLALSQLVCAEKGIETGRIDGLFGPRSEAAFLRFNDSKLGLPEPQWRDHIARPEDTSTEQSPWPTEASVPSYFGELGEGCVLVPLKRLTLPFKMRLAWDLNTQIDGFSVHEKAHESASRAFEQILATYGLSRIEELGLNLFGGCHGCRKKRGGTSWSMHSWAIAIDFDPARNRLEWDKRRARLAQPDAQAFWEIWEREGWTSLGRALDYDWMHVQAARP